MKQIEQPKIPLIVNDEEFKIVKIYDEYYDNYLISNYGRVYSLNRNIILSKRIDSHGYIKYKLSKKGKYKYITAHRLVAFSFVENIYPDKYNTVLHKDDNPTNSKWTNLMWGTCKMNLNWNDCQKRRAAKRSKKVLQFDLENNLIAEYKSLPDLFSKTGYHASKMCKVCRNEELYNGYYWKYAKEGERPYNQNKT